MVGSPAACPCDREVAIGERGDLRQVGDAQDLPASREALQPLADRACGVAADAGVDLVEHERRAPTRRWPLMPPSLQRARQREHHARELAAGGDLAQRGRGTPGFGAITNSAASAPFAFGVGRAQARSRMSHRPSPAPRAARAPRRRALARRLAALLAQGRDVVVRASPAQPRAARRSARWATSAPSSCSRLRARARRARAPRRSCRHACASERSSARSRSSTACSEPSSASICLAVAAQLARRCPAPRSQAPRQRSAERVELVRRRRRPPPAWQRRRPAAAPRPAASEDSGCKRLGGRAGGRAAARRGGAVAPGARAAPVLLLVRRERSRSRPARARAGPARARARSASSRQALKLRTPACGLAIGAGARLQALGVRWPQTSSSICSCALASTSLRCSC